MSAVRSPKTSKVRKDTGPHSIISCRWDNSSSSSSSLSDSPPSTPPSSPRLAKQKLPQHKRPSSGSVPFQSVELADHAHARGKHQGNVPSTETGKRHLRRNRPYEARRPYEREAGRQEREESDSGDTTDGYGVEQCQAKLAFSLSVDDISTSMNSLHVDGMPWWSSRNTEMTQTSPVHSDCRCIPPTPLMTTVPLPYEPCLSIFTEIFTRDFVVYPPLQYKIDLAQRADNVLGLSFS